MCRQHSHINWTMIHHLFKAAFIPEPQPAWPSGMCRLRAAFPSAYALSFWAIQAAADWYFEYSILPMFFKMPLLFFGIPLSPVLLVTALSLCNDFSIGLQVVRSQMFGYNFFLNLLFMTDLWMAWMILSNGLPNQMLMQRNVCMHIAHAPMHTVHVTMDG